MTLALCPCGNYSTPLVVQESVTLSGDACNENNQYRFKMAQIIESRPHWSILLVAKCVPKTLVQPWLN